MKITLKKWISILLVLVMVLGVVVACSKEDEDDDDDEKDKKSFFAQEEIIESEEDTAMEDAAVTDRVQIEDNTITVGVPQRVEGEEYDSNALTKYLESNYGVEIEYIYFSASADEYKQQLSLMISDKEDLPDVIIGFSEMELDMINIYGEDGYFLELTSDITDNMTYYNEKLATLPEDVQDYIEKEGKYSMPIIEGTNVKWGRFITKDCYNLEAVTRLLNALYDDETIELIAQEQILF